MTSPVGNILDGAQQRQLIALKATARAVDEVTEKLATGEDVNRAIDDPQNFFASQALDFRASRIGRILDDIARGAS